MQIKVEDLRIVTAKLFAHLEKSNNSIVEVEHDFYWHIPKELRYDPYQDPSDLSLGQLTDDWNELQKILNNENEPMAYAFVWLSSLLLLVGEEIVS
ncbi:MAG: hypothetical protein ABI947_29210 [Chloroflexota bacterium]